MGLSSNRARRVGGGGRNRDKSRRPSEPSLALLWTFERATESLRVGMTQMFIVGLDGTLPDSARKLKC